MYKIIDSKQSEKSFILKIKIDTLWVDEVHKASLLQAKTIKIPGFRQGKAPFERVQKYISMQRVFQNALSKCLQQVMPSLMKDEILKDKNIIKNNYPEVDIDKIDESFVNVEVKFPLNPKIELPDYKKIKISAEKKTISDAEVKEAIKRILDDDAEMIVKEGDVAQKDDIAVVTYNGKIDGKLEDRLCAKSSEMNLDTTNRFSKAFVDEIVGMKLHETKEFTISLPKKYPLEELADKKVDFSVTLDELKTLKYPEIDEKIVEDISHGEIKSPSELNGWMKKNLQSREDERYVQTVKNQMMEYLLENAKVDLEPSLVEREYEQRVNNLESFFKTQMNANLEQVVSSEGLKLDEFKKTLHDDVEKNVKIGFLVRQIAELEHLVPSVDELNQYRESLKNSQNRDEMQLQRLNNEDLEAQLIYKRVTDALYKWNC